MSLMTYATLTGNKSTAGSIKRDVNYEQIDPAAEPVDYALALTPGANLRALRSALLRASGNQLGVFVPSLSVRGFGWVRAMLAALITSLLAIGLIAAIPATIFYNKFAAEVNKQAQRMEGFADEFAAILSRQIDERGAS